VPEFAEARRRLQEAYAAHARAREAMRAAKDRLARLTAAESVQSRSFTTGSTSHEAARKRLATARAEAEKQLTTGRAAEKDAAALAAAAFADFARVSDPRSQIERLTDDIPILLFPVRLETRFKTVAAAGAAVRRQLWVRVYPDDCSIDTFESRLSESEVANAQLYWTGIWESGGIQVQDRGAWRGLVGAHGSGRASWIIEQYQPLNLGEKPAKALPTDIILTIPTSTPLAPAEVAAAVTFWRDSWLADGDSAAREAASAALVAAVGDGRAAEIVERYVPVNFGKAPTPPLTRAEVAVGVAFVVFRPNEDLDTREHSWSQAPKAVALPDRFVFLGYADSAPPLVALGNPIPEPLIVGPDPAAEEDDLLRQENGELKIPEAMRWMVEFDEAVRVGMGFRIDLSETQAARGFDHVLVLGLRLRGDGDDGQSALSTLIEHHHFSRSGFSLVPQGTPTNNTDVVSAGYDRVDDADASFDDLAAGDLFTDTSSWRDKKDGQWLAEYLGIDTAVLKKVRHSGGSDQQEARAMHAALWPATLGYWMETMMAPVFTTGGIRSTREFFVNFVSGRGAIPAVRIGRQPYGILPATAFSNMRWMRQTATGSAVLPPAGSEAAFLLRLYTILRAIDEDWTQMANGVSFVGKPGDAHQILLDIVGLHPGSAEFSQRYAESGEQLFNRLNLEGLGALFAALIAGALAQEGADLLTKLGYAGGEAPEILGKFFFGQHNTLKGPVVQEGPLSESDPLRPATADGTKNYLEWLLDAANTSQHALYVQQGFIGNKPPKALLYLMLRHALQLGYHDTAVQLHLVAGLLNQDQAALAKRDAPFIHIAEQAVAGESKYGLLYKTEPVITGNATTRVGDHIAAHLGTLAAAGPLRSQLAAVELLKDASTARLERAFCEHIDCCAYRLDAWLLGLVHWQLARMRNLTDGVNAPTRRGVHLGAYAWLENVRPDANVLSPAPVPPDLEEIFNPRADPPLLRDSANQGYIHAPSLNHAVAAAVLRNGYISNASEENRQTMAVNLTSARVRTALGLIEGIRAGQSLGALLGYQFERGLHDRHGLAEVDKFIYDLRGAFPLRANRLERTRTGPGVPIEAIEARNVLDGLALVSHIRETGLTMYPFGKELPEATAPEADAINTEVDRVLESHDAVADLALAEGVYQAVQGNYDRVASTYDAYSKGNFPPEPQVVKTPASGLPLTHRVALHLESGLNPTESPAAAAMTPRAQGEPAINKWLAAVLPGADQIACVITFFDPATQALVDREITLDQLQLQPVDLLRLIRDEHQQAMSELDDRVVRVAIAAHAPRPDVPVSIQYMAKVLAPFSVFEVMPLVRHLAAITSRSRPLRASDLTLTNEATVSQDNTPFLDPQRILLVRAAMQVVREALTGFRTELEGPLEDLENRRDEILTGVEGLIGTFTTLMALAADFAIPQAGWGSAYAFKQHAFVAALEKASALVTRWNERLVAFNDLIVEYDNLPSTATDAERFELLQRAEPFISTTRTDSLPAAPDDFRSDLLDQRDLFVARRDEFAAMQQTTRTSITLLFGDLMALSTGEFDFVEFSLADEEDTIIRFAQDTLAVVKVVGAEMDRRLNAAQNLLAEHDAAADASVRVSRLEAAGKALLGDDFVMVPEFRLSAAQGDEIENALTASQSGTLFHHLVNAVQIDFPIDTWLYGVARVREKMHAWEQLVMHAGALTSEPELTPIQLPFQADDRWLALEFPPAAAPTSERLLYTAHYAAPFDKTAAHCGLLLDEWSEVIPARDATTGIAFHYDRPNSEAPQAMLLVTPTEFRGAWQWSDLVDALNETLNLAKRRAVEPAQVDQLAYARFLPATIMAVTVSQLTISANLALNNNVELMMMDA
jgi:hypothetical protein